MKTKSQALRVAYALSLAFLITSCQKEGVTSSSTGTSTAATIAVAATESGVTAAADSVYILQNCGRGGHRDSIAQADLLSSITTYIDANYAGSTFHKAFAIKNSSGTISGYVVIIFYNDKPVGLQFDANGTFVKVLEQRERGDLDGPGHHRGGRFENRDGMQRDTIAISALPAAITNYFATNYPADTLVKAFKGKDNSIVVISKNNGPYATVFDANNNFVKREQLPTKNGSCQSVEQSALPSAALNYLNQTYPNYVFDKAFSISNNGAIAAFVVVIDANNTRYAVLFDASGNFVKAKTIF
jgi:hypothetical protein